MRLRKWLAVTAALLLVLFLLVNVAGAQNHGSETFVAILTGANEVPGPGDPNGIGFAVVFLNPHLDLVCWGIAVQAIEEPFAAHIHVGDATVAGPVVIPLSPIRSGCTFADGDLIDAIIANPGGYYVNVHNDPFPDGALRGQLQALPNDS